MEKDIDLKKYNEYFEGKEEVFEYLYTKYKIKVVYFIYNIVKDYHKAEDLAQETFMYIIQNRIKSDISFKYYLFLVAKSKALNYLKVKNRRGELIEKYITINEENQNDLLDGIIQKESDRELLESINLLRDNYKNAIYLVYFEGLSYKETAEILGKSLQNTKNIVHRGKMELRKIIWKKGFERVNKNLRTIIYLVIIIASLSGIIYSATKIYGEARGKANMTPIFSSQISTMDTNKVWCGTFNLVWNDFMNNVIGHRIEFIDGYSEMANELNKQEFTVNELNEESYFIIHGIENIDMKNRIIDGIKDKFNEESQIIDRCDFDNEKSGFVLYAMLKKEFNYLEEFSIVEDETFGDSQEKFKYFGLEPNYVQSTSKNIDILFYNSMEDFAIKLKTKEGEEVYLYRTSGENQSFLEVYSEMIMKKDSYSGNDGWEKNDYLKIPFIRVNDEINYDELCGRYIQKTNWYIKQALQTIHFELNNCGGSVKSEALIEAQKTGMAEKGREFLFNDEFILFLKEEDKEKPYFALKVDNCDLLEVVNE